MRLCNTAQPMSILQLRPEIGLLKGCTTQSVRSRELGGLPDIYVVARSQLTCTRRLPTTNAPLPGRIGFIFFSQHCHSSLIASVSARHEPASAACFNIIQVVQAKWLLLSRTNLDIALPEVGDTAVEGRQDEVHTTRAPEWTSR